MDISKDLISRELRAIDAEHKATLKADVELIDRLYQEEAPTQAKWDLLAGGANRSRTFMKVGGVAVLTAAVLAACGDNEDEVGSSTGTSAPGGASTTVAGSGGGNQLAAEDVNIMKFAASLENLAVAAYTMGAPLLTDATVKGVATLFMQHHKEHAAAFNAALKSAGQTEVTEPNAAVLAQLKPQLDALKTQADVLKFAQAVELKAAATYLSSVGVLKGPKLGYTAISIGGTEYRHYSLLAMVNGDTAAKPAFLTTKEAIAPVGV